MKKAISLALIMSLLPTTAFANGTTSVNSDNLRNNQNNETEQENVGVINQTSVYSVGNASRYGIDSIYCPRPSAVISGATSGGNDYNNTYSISGSFILPLGGRIGRLCEEAFEARTIHYQLSNEVAVSKECSQLLAAGLNLNSAQFPLLSQYCEGVGTKKESLLIEVEKEIFKPLNACEIRARFTEELTGEDTECPLK